MEGIKITLNEHLYREKARFVRSHCIQENGQPIWCKKCPMWDGKCLHPLKPRGKTVNIEVVK